MEIPSAFQERMKKMLGTDFEAFLASYEKEHMQGLRINLLKAETGDLLEDSSFHLKQIPWVSEGYYYEASDRPGRHPYHEAGVYYIQEPSAMAVAACLDPKPGERILDLCAAPGGKSSHIASRLQNKGFLVSNEIHPSRAKILSQNIERMGIRNAVVTNEDSKHLTEYFPEFFDGIIVDAPCSGEGMFRKDEEARKEWSLENVKLCAVRQREILHQASEMLSPGGRMVYSTCTFSAEENEEVIEAFLEEHSEFQLIQIKEYTGFSKGVPEWSKEGNEELRKTVRIWPHKADGEGHFMALMKKKGVFSERKRKTPVYLKDKQLWNIYEEFCIQTLKEPDQWINGKNKILFGEQLYMIPEDMPDFNRLKVLRPGLHLGTFKKNRFEPSHAFAESLKKEEVLSAETFEANSLEIHSYLKGEVLKKVAEDPKKSEKGWVLITVEGYSLGWAKRSGELLKNHYPKGLRK